MRFAPPAPPYTLILHAENLFVKFFLRKISRIVYCFAKRPLNRTTTAPVFKVKPDSVQYRFIYTFLYRRAYFCTIALNGIIHLFNKTKKTA